MACWVHDTIGAKQFLQQNRDVPSTPKPSCTISQAIVHCSPFSLLDIPCLLRLLSPTLDPSKFLSRSSSLEREREREMKAVLPLPGDYVNFKSLVPLHKISVGLKQWRYYDFGPKAVPPLICIPGIAGTADVYYKQIMALSMKGYRVISIDIPRVWNHLEWIHAFEKFLDFLNVHHVHIYGTSLGGFLAQIFAQHRPRRVKSLVLSNSFLDTHKFAAAMPWAPVVNWAPSFMLKRHILTGIHDGPHEPFIADSVDFVVGQVETLSRDDLSSRLLLNVNVASVGPISLPDTLITIMDTNDYCAVPQELKDQLNERYPGARKAVLKTGGDFPFLSRSDEVNLYLQLHLRRVGVEARPDLLQGIPRYDGGAGSSNSGGDSSGSHFDNNKGDPHGGQNGRDDLQDFGSEPLDSDEPVPTSTMYDSLALCTVKFAILEGLHAHLLLQHFCVAFCLYMSRSKASLVA